MGYVGTKPTAAPLTSAQLEDGLVTAAKLATDAVETAKVKDLNVTNAKIAATTIDVTAKITGTVPTANLGSGSASSTTILYGDQTYKTEPAEYDDNVIQSNIAMLGFKVAVNGSLTRYNLVDQSIDEFYDTSGVDASASTNEQRVASGSNFYYDGGTSATITQDADATGTDGDYTWYKWTDTGATGSFVTSVTQDVEYLIVGGGASGGRSNAGGGGAGGVLTATGLSLTGGNTYTATIGAGGTAISSGNTNGNVGGDSILSGTGISTLTGGGGGYGGNQSENGGPGRATNGNGGGGAYNNATGGAGDGAGFDGGDGAAIASEYGAGGGGGAGEVGEDGTGAKAGDGGDGVANDIIETGTDVYYGGGGGGNGTSGYGAPGGNGGGGASGPTSGDSGVAGTANTGGGGGAAYNNPGTSGAGGSGVVILRRLTSVVTAGQDLTLQSTDVTAVAEPDFGEFVTLIENASGTATLNTDIKGYISRDSGTTFTQGTLVDEGTWGTNKKILGFHDLDISSQPSGTSMCYKIETLNQSASVKETRIYASSIGWR